MVIMIFAIMEQLYFRPVTFKVWHCGPLDSVRLTLYLELWHQNRIRFFWCKLHWLGANCFKVIYLLVYICFCTCIHLSISPHTVSLPQIFPSMPPLNSCASMVRCKLFWFKYGITTIASRLGTINFSVNTLDFYKLQFCLPTINKISCFHCLPLSQFSFPNQARPQKCLGP